MSRDPIFLQLHHNQHDAIRWQRIFQPVADGLEELLGSTGTVTIRPDDNQVDITWRQGLTRWDVVSYVGDKIGKSNGGGDNDCVWWSGLTLVLDVQQDLAAYGLAAIAATIGAGCPMCEFDNDDPWKSVYRLHLQRRDPHLIDTHRNLDAVLDAETLIRIAEVIAAAAGTDSEKDIIEYVHHNGHLPGLICLDTALHG